MKKFKFCLMLFLSINIITSAFFVQNVFANSDFIEIKSEGFLGELVKIGSNIETYRGKKIKVQGIIYKDESMKKDEFVISRLMPEKEGTNCKIVGLLCKYSKAGKYKLNEWVDIEGEVTTTPFKNPKTGETKDFPSINIKKIKVIEPLQSPFVYSFNDCKNKS